MTTRVTPWFVCEDGYPTDESLELLSAWLKTCSPEDAAKFMLYDFPAICGEISSCSVDLQDWPKEELSLFSFHEKNVKKLLFSTGGWSGAEALIETVLASHMIAFMHMRWQRGGHYEFEIPLSWIKD